MDILPSSTSKLKRYHSKMAKLEEVFGVSAKPIQSYVERDEVDSRFRDAIDSDKQIVVYGSSKQGKTALVSKYLPYEKNLLVSLTPRTDILDIYQTVLHKAGIKLSAGATEKKSTEASMGLGAKVKAMIPLFGGGEVSTKAEIKAGSGEEIKYEEVPIIFTSPSTSRISYTK